MTNNIKSDARCYVALDLPSVAEAEAMVATLGDAVESYKIGLQLLPIGGVEFGQRIYSPSMRGLMLCGLQQKGEEGLR